MLIPGDLRVLDLEGVAVTALVLPDGSLAPVDRLWEKMDRQAIDLASRGLLHTVVVADEQVGVPEEYLSDTGAPLLVIKAKSVADAARKLNEQSSARRAVDSFERAACEYLEFIDRRAPIATHYRVLPLLREVMRERLGYDVLSGRGHDGDDNNPSPDDILRWEEEWHGERVEYERLTWEQLFEDFSASVDGAKTSTPRFVVLGPPGSGKTTSVQYMAWLAARCRLPASGRRLIPARVRLREWERWALSPGNPVVGLAEYLSAAYRQAGVSPAPTAEHWARWLRRGEALLLLDGLDEVADQSPFLDILQKNLAAHPKCPTVLTCRTVSYARHGSLCPDFPVLTLAGLDETQRDEFVRSFPVRLGGHFDPEALIAHLYSSAQLRPLAASPLLLAIICYVSADPQRGELPETRCELYDAAITKLLTLPRRKALAYPGGKADLPLIRKRRILERAALSLFAANTHGRQLLFEESSLVDALTEAAAAEGLRDAADVADVLIEDLTQNSGILRGVKGGKYFFLHLTIQEFLAAGALARLVDHHEAGWEAEVKVRGQKVTVAQLFEKKSWAMRWRECLIMLAGQLRDPAPMLKSLADAYKDDLAATRLSLAVSCLPEIPAATRAQNDELVNYVAACALAMWLHHFQYDTTAAVPHITRVMPVLAQINARMELIKGEATLFDLICFYLKSEKGMDFRAGMELIKLMGGAAARPEFLDRLAGMLRSPDENSREGAKRGLMALAGAAATRSLLDWLTELLRMPDTEVRDEAVDLLSNIGTSAAQPQFLDDLAELLRHPDSGVRRTAAEVLQHLGSDAATPAVLDGLIRMLQEPDRECRSKAVDALKSFGEAAARPELFDQLGRLLLHDDVKVRRDAVSVLSGVGGASLPLQIVNLLIRLLREHNPEIQDAAANAVKVIARAIPQSDFLDLAGCLLRDSTFDVRMRVLDELENMGGGAAKREFIDQLVANLESDDLWARRAALWALERLGGGAAAPDTLCQLTSALQDPDYGVRLAAVRALGHLGLAAMKPAVIGQMEALLQDENKDVRREAAYAVVNVKANSVMVLGLLEDAAEMLQSPDWIGLNAAAEFVNLFREMSHAAGKAHPPMDVFDDLVHFLREAEWDVPEAVRQVRRITGEAFATSHLAEELAEMLQAEDLDLRRAAMGGIQTLGEAVAEPCLLEQLTSMLYEDDAFKVAEAAEGIRAIGEAAATPEILDRLAWLLSVSNDYARLMAEATIKEIGGAAVTPEFTGLLVEMLHDPDREVRTRILLSVGKLGESFAGPAIRDLLYEMLEDEEPFVGFVAALTTVSLGFAAEAPHEILARLSDILTKAGADPHPNVRSAAAHAKSKMMRSGIHFFLVGGEVKPKHIAELMRL